MTRRSGRTHSAALKAKVALAALKGGKTLEELAQQDDVYPSQITAWKQQLVEHAADLLGAGKENAGEPAVDPKVLHAKVGQLALENDFLSGAALSKAGLLSAKR